MGAQLEVLKSYFYFIELHTDSRREKKIWAGYRYPGIKDNDLVMDYILSLPSPLHSSFNR
jgi:hypothetical protein